MTIGRAVGEVVPNGGATNDPVVVGTVGCAVVVVACGSVVVASCGSFVVVATDESFAVVTRGSFVVVATVESFAVVTGGSIVVTVTGGSIVVTVTGGSVLGGTYDVSQHSVVSVGQAGSLFVGVDPAIGTSPAPNAPAAAPATRNARAPLVMTTSESPAHRRPIPARHQAFAPRDTPTRVIDYLFRAAGRPAQLSECNCVAHSIRMRRSLVQGATSSRTRLRTTAMADSSAATTLAESCVGAAVIRHNEGRESRFDGIDLKV
ncbi:hypothetical protein [Nocardia amikacinitolerans]|uniref:hypothetical protein n=1 Tax=Nocardia amikacinitolerans TaxID=756689 RepID=UPI0020A2D100|nr:hypothetical protein [Nocardia amikacinitolerans]